eukprot:5242062-Pyramimonas_sp.AAC.1
MAHGASSQAPDRLLDTCARALRSQHSAWHWRPHWGLHIFSRSEKDSRQTAHCAKDLSDTASASVLGRVRPCRCSADSPASQGGGGGPPREL